MKPGVGPCSLRVRASRLVAGRYAIETVEGRRLAFDATSGRLAAAR
jgi:hypothetical protein